MYGDISGLTSGKIISYNEENYYERSGYEFSEFGSASYKSVDGDSGGPVLVYNGASNYSLIGINCAVYHKDGTDVYKSYFTPYKNIVEALGVTCVPYYS